VPGAPPRVPDDTREAIVAAVRAGERRAAVARRFGVSDTTVTNFARAAGVLDPPISLARRDAIRAAAELNSELAKYRRSKEALALLQDAKRLRLQLFRPSKVYAFGRDADGVHAYVEHPVPEPDAKAKQALMISAGIAYQRALELARFGMEDQAGGQVRAAIIDLTERLAAEVADEAHHQGGTLA
jgi:transposase-like protein